MEGKRERNINVPERYQSAASHTPPTGDLAHNPGMCLDRVEGKPVTFWLWDNIHPLSHTSQGTTGNILMNFLLVIF